MTVRGRSLLGRGLPYTSKVSASACLSTKVHFMLLSCGYGDLFCLRVTCKSTMVHESAKRVFAIYGDDWRFVPNGPGKREQGILQLIANPEPCRNGEDALTSHYSRGRFWESKH